ncbi:T9SS type A sorting domain-containing protein [Sanyastnella coralliicola]|uniref:T9SS type A sorting domain-containing protein n=1 Tax=Sanyastnella coralliicola TaxID=3069118 RepID=UPI0027BA55F1|nr:T9SS type A sorting domain-containing protein [Longitalea sp. SCSIO 12813]
MILTKLLRSCFLAVAVLLSSSLFAQLCQHPGGHTVQCMGLIGLEEQHDSFIAPPASFVPNGERDVVISVNYNGFTPEAQAAFQYAVDIWSSLLTSSVPIIIDATWEDIDGNTLGFAGASGYFQNFANAPEANTFYPSALADKLAGFNLQGGADIEASFDSGTNWYFGTDGNPGFGQFDFVSVVLHELGHGLGVVGSAGVDGTTGFFFFSNPSIYDTYVENGSNSSILNFPDNSFSLYQQLTSDNLFWNGPAAVGNNGGTDPQLYAPSSWAQGSSYSHVDEDSYPAGNANSLMTPFIAPGEAIHDPGPIIMGLMEDIGWTVEEPAPCVDSGYTFSLTPDCYGSEITWEVLNSNGVAVASGGPYADLLPESITTIDTDLCLTSGCYTFNIYDSFGDGLNGSAEAGCGVDGDFTMFDENGAVVFTMASSTYGDQDTYDFCVDDNGGGGDDCTNLDMDIVEGPCADNGNGLLPTITLTMTWNGDCIVQDFCFSTDGVNFDCFDLPALADPILLESGDPLDFVDLDPNTEYTFYYTLTDGATSGEYTFTTGDCNNEDTICDCLGTEHTIGVLTWLGDGFEDDGTYQWEGQPVDFNCETWGYDCGDFGTVGDPFGVCDGNLPPNNGCGDLTSCTNLDMTVIDTGCADNGFGELPTIDVLVSWNGDCLVEDFCFAIDGETFTCFNLPTQDPPLLIESGDAIGFINLDPDTEYTFYYTLSDGTVSEEFLYTSSNCDDEVFGCTDPNATNYNPLATSDDGSCIYDDCVPTGITLSEDCFFDEVNQEIVNRILVNVEISGDCIIENVCFTPTGGGDETCFFLPDFDIFLEDGDGVFIPVPEAGEYDVYVTTAEGVSPVETIAVDCSDAIVGCGNPFALNYNPIVEINDEAQCIYDEFICDCSGNQHTIGVLVWLGDGFLDDGSFEWDGQTVDFNCETWGYDCADGGINDDPNGVCEGNLPPNNGCAGCGPVSGTAYQEDCLDTGDGVGILPVIGFDISINGDCLITEFCFQEDGGGYTCFDFAELELEIGDGDGLILNNTTPGGSYEFYFTTDDGSISPVFTWENGDCENEETICDCAGTQHTIGVLAWLGDGLEDDGSFTWDGNPVDFNCQTWGYDCGDFGINDDPNGVCDGNLPPNNGCVGEILGCTDPTALNYDPSATLNDGSCIYDIEGCDDILACNYDPEATVNDGSCDYDCYGCTDPTAINYDSNATEDDGSCIYDVEGCTDPVANNYDPDATIDDGSCTYDDEGCTDPEACNYNPEATIDDGSCDYSCYGCTDPTANNYDPDATIDDGSCTYDDEGCTDPEACNYNPDATVDDGSCDYSCYGCTDPLASNYDPDATIDDGSCIYDGLGCTDPEACNYNPDATVDDGSCDYSCYGCTDPEACNYDADATVDDDSCEYETCAGCTNEFAINYDPNATIDDGSCIDDCELPIVDLSDIGCLDGDNEFYIEIDVTEYGNVGPYVVSNDQDNNTDIIDGTGTLLYGPFVDGDIVTITIESEEFDVCILELAGYGCDTSVELIESTVWEVYPNPANEVLIIEGFANENMMIELVDLTGKLIMSENIPAGNLRYEMNVSSLASGMYFVKMTDSNGARTERVVVKH